MPLAVLLPKMEAESMATLEWLTKKPSISPSPGMPRNLLSKKRGPSPVHFDTDTVIGECQIAELKVEVVEYKTYLSVEN